MMTLSSLIPLLIYNFKSESELISSIGEISKKFTTDRDRIHDYLKDPRLVSAYTAFYLLTNIPKLTEVFKWMPVNFERKFSDCDFIDLGAGPGTYSLAWKELVRPKGDFYQIEQSSLMQEQAKKIWHGLHKETLYQSTKWQWISNKEKVLLFGHSANEMGAKVAIDYIEKINPDHVFFIEPGTKSFFPVMLEIRNYLIEKNFSILFPCSNTQSCPMANTSDWCHQFIQVRQDEEIERISQMAKLDRKLLPLTVQVFSKTLQAENHHERVVRVLPETKFSYRWLVCHDNKLANYEVMKRDLTKFESKDLESILSGASVQTELVKDMGDTKRVKVTKK